MITIVKQKLKALKLAELNYSNRFFHYQNNTRNHVTTQIDDIYMMHRYKPRENT